MNFNKFSLRICLQKYLLSVPENKSNNTHTHKSRFNKRLCSVFGVDVPWEPNHLYVRPCTVTTVSARAESTVLVSVLQPDSEAATATLGAGRQCLSSPVSVPSNAGPCPATPLHSGGSQAAVRQSEHHLLQPETRLRSQDQPHHRRKTSLSPLILFI